jgi:hypothetical protein
MAALTVATDRAAAGEAGTAGPASARSAGPAAADRSGAGVRADRAVRSWPLLVLAAPAAAEVWSGWVGIAQKTGFGLVRPLPGIWPALHLDTAITLPIGVEAYAAYALRAWLARDRAISGRTRRFAKWSAICSFTLGMAGQVAYHLMAQSGMTRAPWAITTVVSCLPVLVLGMGTALAHMLRADAEATDAPGSQTGPPAAPRSLPWSAEDQDRPGRMRPETDQARSPGRDQHGETPGPQHGGDVTGPGPLRTGASGSGTRHRPPAYRGRKARVAASVALRRSPGLKRGAERPGTHDEQRASRSSAATCSGWLTQPASFVAVVSGLRRSAACVSPDSRRPEALCDHEGVPRGTAARWKRRYAVRLTVPRRGGRRERRRCRRGRMPRPVAAIIRPRCTRLGVSPVSA